MSYSPASLHEKLHSPSKLLDLSATHEATCWRHANKRYILEEFHTLSCESSGIGRIGALQMRYAPFAEKLSLLPPSLSVTDMVASACRVFPGRIRSREIADISHVTAEVSAPLSLSSSDTNLHVRRTNTSLIGNWRCRGLGSQRKPSVYMNNMIVDQQPHLA